VRDTSKHVALEQSLHAAEPSAGGSGEPARPRLAEAFALALLSAILLGLGTASVYPTLIAAISDQTTPLARATTVGVYRFWRDLGYALGGAIAGATADALGYPAAITLVAALTAASGLWAAAELPGRSKHLSGRHSRRRRRWPAARNQHYRAGL